MKDELKRFNDYWDNVLEPLCEKSTRNGGELWARACHAKTEEEKDAITEEMKHVDRVDWYALDFIAQAVVAVNICLIEDKNPKEFLTQIKSVFNNQEYFDKIFGENQNCEEAVQYKEIGKYLNFAWDLLP